MLFKGVCVTVETCIATSPSGWEIVFWVVSTSTWRIPRRQFHQQWILSVQKQVLDFFLTSMRLFICSGLPNPFAFRAKCVYLTVLGCFSFLTQSWILAFEEMTLQLEYVRHMRELYLSKAQAAVMGKFSRRVGVTIANRCQVHVIVTIHTEQTERTRKSGNQDGNMKLSLKIQTLILIYDMICIDMY